MAPNEQPLSAEELARLSHCFANAGLLRCGEAPASLLAGALVSANDGIRTIIEDAMGRSFCRDCARARA